MTKKPTNDKGDVKIIITADSINAVFQQYPLVKIAHQDLVLTKKMTDSQFWHQYYQSSFTKDDSYSFGSGNSITFEDNALEKYYRQTKAEMVKTQKNTESVNEEENIDKISHLINITNDDRFDYENEKPTRMQSQKTQETFAIIHKYNEMSARALRETAKLNVVAKESLSSSISNPFPSLEERKKKRREEDSKELILKDLNLNNENGTERKIERQIKGEKDSSLNSMSINTFDSIEESKFFKILMEYQPLIDNAINDPISYSDYKKSWDKYFSSPLDFQDQLNKITCITVQELANYCSQVIEILKLFWGTYPPQSDLQQAKLVRITQALKRIKNEMMTLPIVEGEKSIIDSLLKDTMIPLDYAIELIDEIKEKDDGEEGEGEGEEHINKKIKTRTN